MKRILWCLVVALASCMFGAVDARTPPAPPPPNDLLDAVAWTQTSMEHDLIYREVYRHATEVLAKALADPSWDALSARALRGNPNPRGLKPAVVLDVDETVLDNSPYEARLIRDHAYYNEATWGAWAREEKARALPGSLAFTRYAAAHGIAVIYMSDRVKSLRKPTLANLKTDGFPVRGPDAYLDLGTRVPGCKQIGTSKSCRRWLVAKKYRVLVQVGDQIGDLMQLNGKTPAARRAEFRPYLKWVGQRWFVLPQPMYGDWDTDLYDNDTRLSPAERRADKLKALRYN